MMSTLTFRTHKGETVTGQRLLTALSQAADDMIGLAKDIRLEDAYADHVSEEVKDRVMLYDLNHAERVRGGDIDNLTTWQNVNYILTGECVALLP